MNDNDLFGEIDSYLDTIDAKSTTGSDTPFSLPSFPSPTSSPISRVANNLFAPPTPPSSSTPPLRRVGPAISPLKTGFNDGNVSSGSTSASFVGNGGGGGIVSTCSGNGSSMTSVVQERLLTKSVTLNGKKFYILYYRFSV